MARRRRSSRRRKTRIQVRKQTRIYSSPRLGFRSLRRPTLPNRVKRRRAFTPVASSRNTRSNPRRLHSPPHRSSLAPVWGSHYAVKGKTHKPHTKRSVCANRRIRREIIFALKKHGKAGQKPPVRRFPDIRCKKRRK